MSPVHFAARAPDARRRSIPSSLLAAARAAAGALLALSGAAHAGTVYLNGLALPGAALDVSGGTGVNSGRLGYFSDLYYDTMRHEWWGLSDRGPGGGSLPYDTRVQRFTLDVNPSTGAISQFQVVETVLFSAAGQSLSGAAPSTSSVLGNAFDPEGFVVLRNGHFLVSDEYGPSLIEFTRQGQLVRRFTLPANLVPRDAATGVANHASDAGNTAGKRTNRGFEGLAISPDGKYAYAMLQSAMLDEGGGNGVYNRIVQYDVATGKAVAQYAYRMKRSGQGQGISALVAINDTEFFVLERNNRGVGVGAELATADKELYRINLTGATDVTGIDLDAPGATFTPVAKSAAVLDLDANTMAALGGKAPEKLEGLAIGPQLANGSYLLLTGTDNDYSVTQNASGTQFDVYFLMASADPYAASIQCPLGQTTACFFTTGGAAATLTSAYSLLPGVLQAYAMDAATLGAYVSPASVPEPASLALLALAGAAVAGSTRRLRTLHLRTQGR